MTITQSGPSLSRKKNAFKGLGGFFGGFDPFGGKPQATWGLTQSVARWWLNRPNAKALRDERAASDSEVAEFAVHKVAWWFEPLLSLVLLPLGIYGIVHGMVGADFNNGSFALLGLISFGQFIFSHWDGVYVPHETGPPKWISFKDTPHPWRARLATWRVLAGQTLPFHLPFYLVMMLMPHISLPVALTLAVIAFVWAAVTHKRYNDFKALEKGLPYATSATGDSQGRSGTVRSGEFVAVIESIIKEAHGNPGKTVFSSAQRLNALLKNSTSDEVVSSFTKISYNGEYGNHAVIASISLDQNREVRVEVSWYQYDEDWKIRFYSNRLPALTSGITVASRWFGTYPGIQDLALLLRNHRTGADQFKGTLDKADGDLSSLYNDPELQPYLERNKLDAFFAEAEALRRDANSATETEWRALNVKADALYERIKDFKQQATNKATAAREQARAEEARRNQSRREEHSQYGHIPPRSNPSPLTLKEAYELLSLNRTSLIEMLTDRQIEPFKKTVKGAYRTLALRWHPDRVRAEGDKAEATARMTQVNLAFEKVKADLEHEAFRVSGERVTLGESTGGRINVASLFAEILQEVSSELSMHWTDAAPNIPSGWTLLLHGTNLARKEWDGKVDQLPDGSELKVQGLFGLSVITQEDLQRDQQAGLSGTTKEYSSIRQRADLTPDVFAARNVPIYLKTLFPQNYINFSELREQYLPIVPSERREALLKLIGIYYTNNVQFGRHPVVPGGTRLIKLAQRQEGDVQVIYFIPEEVHDLYLSRLNPPAQAVVFNSNGAYQAEQFLSLHPMLETIVSFGVGLVMTWGALNTVGIHSPLVMIISALGIGYLAFHRWITAPRVFRSRIVPRIRNFLTAA